MTQSRSLCVSVNDSAKVNAHTQQACDQPHNKTAEREHRLRFLYHDRSISDRRLKNAMAIRPSSTLSNGAYYEKLQGQIAQDTRADLAAGRNPNDYYQFKGDPAPFRPTGKGLAVRTPDFPATEWNANACLINHGAGNPSARLDYLRKTYLFVDSVETGWQVSGDFSQAQSARTFYPKNLKQDDVTIIGYVANQNEYDKLATFVQHAHYTAVSGAQFSSDWQHFVDFLMFRPHNKAGAPQDNTYDYWPSSTDGRINWGVLLTGIEAGAERFQFAKQFLLTAKVIDDRSDQWRDQLYSDLTDISYTQIFGDYTSTKHVTAGTTPDPATKTTTRRTIKGGVTTITTTTQTGP